jgi:hypothetical protein
MIDNALLEESVMIDNHYRNETMFQPPKSVNGIPEGYMTSEVFRTTVKEKLRTRLHENGYLYN